MPKKIVNCRIDEDIIRDMKAISSEKGLTDSQYIRRALENQIKEDYIEIGGGIVGAVQNPQFVIDEDPEILEAIADAFDDLDRKLRRISPITRDLFQTESVSRFIEERLLIFPEKKEEFESSLKNITDEVRIKKAIDEGLVSFGWVSDSEP